MTRLKIESLGEKVVDFQFAEPKLSYYQVPLDKIFINLFLTSGLIVISLRYIGCYGDRIRFGLRWGLSIVDLTKIYII